MFFTGFPSFFSITNLLKSTDYHHYHRGLWTAEKNLPGICLRWKKTWFKNDWFDSIFTQIDPWESNQICFVLFSFCQLFPHFPTQSVYQFESKLIFFFSSSKVNISFFFLRYFIHIKVWIELQEIFEKIESI